VTSQMQLDVPTWFARVERTADGVQIGDGVQVAIAKA